MIVLPPIVYRRDGTMYGHPTGGGGMLIRLLGKPEVIVDEACLDLGTPRQRVTLAVLLLADGMAVPVDALVDRIWDDTPPARCRNLVATYVSRLRRILASAPGEPVRIVHRHGTYTVTGVGDALDLQRFRAAVRHARAALVGGERAQAVEHYDDALAHWHGPALAGLPGRWIATAAAQLDRERRDAQAARVDVLLSLDQAERAVPELQSLILDHPVDEQFAQQLMSALHLSGRDAEAFGVYEALCRRLREHLGVEPSASVQALHVELLRTQPRAVQAPQRTTPAQLPKDVPGFTGRDAALRWLDDLLETAPGTTAVLTAVGGMAGVGKTALAVHWGHRVRHRFADGQLYVNLQGYSPDAPLSAAEALGQFLRALGVPAERVPPEAGEAAALYRSVMATRRMLVVLDNVATVEQVRPLLPGARECVVLITSRDRLTGLIALDDARRLDLDVLPPTEAIALLVRILGAERVAADGDGAAALAHACGHLPLALRIAAANLLDRTDVGLGEYAAALIGEHRLRAFRVDGDAQADVRAAFDASYRRLPTGTARVYRLLGLHFGSGLTVEAAASLAGVGITPAKAALDELVRAHLVQEGFEGRYTLHDLLRRYAVELAGATDSDADGHEAHRRLLDHYTYAAHAADRLAYPHRDVVALPPPPTGVTTTQFDDAAEALAWLTRERTTLLAAIRAAASLGADRRAYQMCWALADFLDRRGHWHDWRWASNTALEAAQRLAEPALAGHAQRSLARAEARLGYIDAAVRRFRLALEAFEAIGDETGQAHTHRNLAHAYDQQGDHASALAHAEAAFELFRQVGHIGAQASSLNTVGWYHGLLGNHSRALWYCEQALSLLQHLGDRHGEASTWDSLGLIHHNLGQPAQAITCYQRAVDLFRELGNRYYEASSLNRLGDMLCAARDRAGASAAWQRALDILAQLDHADADRVRTKLRPHGWLGHRRAVTGSVAHPQVQPRVADHLT